MKTDIINQNKFSTPILKNKFHKLMFEYVGIDNSISSRDLFIKLFSSPENFSNEQRYLLITRINHLVRSLRSNGFFICSIHNTKQGHIYYVPKTQRDYALYREYNTMRINNLKELTQKCLSFVKNKGYKQKRLS